MNNDKLVELISEEAILNKVASLGATITKDFKNKDLVVVSILKGSFIFTADLVRHIDLPLSISFMVVSSYGSSTESSGNLKIKYDVDIDLKDKDVLIVEDIVDTGLTMQSLKKFLSDKGASSVKVCTIFDKLERRIVDVTVDYKGFDIPNEFVVGYGLDYDNKYRNLKGLYKVIV